MKFIGFAFVVFTCPAVAMAQQSGRPAATTTPVELNASIEKLSIAATLGDPQAASKLSDYFRFEKNQDEKWKYWALIAAENGDPGSQFDEYNILSESDAPLVQQRAYFWLKKSAQGGFSGATIELKRCFPDGKFESKKSSCLGTKRN